MITKSKVIYYEFEDVDGKYTRYDLCVMPMENFKMIVSFLDKEDISDLINILGGYCESKVSYLSELLRRLVQ